MAVDGVRLWGRGRIELMKRADAFLCYQTGWLVRLRGLPAAFDRGWQRSQVKEGIS